MIVRDLNIPLMAEDTPSKLKISKEISALNDILNQMDIIDIYGAFHTKTSDYTVFSSTHGTFSRIDHKLGHKTSLKKCEKTEIIPSILSDHNVLKLEINCKMEVKAPRYVEII